jgi:phage-related holin
MILLLGLLCVLLQSILFKVYNRSKSFGGVAYHKKYMVCFAVIAASFFDSILRSRHHELKRLN